MIIEKIGIHWFSALLLELIFTVPILVLRCECPAFTAVYMKLSRCLLLGFIHNLQVTGVYN